jgi:hypothetical protein
LKSTLAVTHRNPSCKFGKNDSMGSWKSGTTQYMLQCSLSYQVVRAARSTAPKATPTSSNVINVTMFDYFMIAVALVSLPAGWYVWITFVTDNTSTAAKRLICEAVIVGVLTTWNFAAAIHYGRPFYQGHVVDGLVCLSSGSALNLGLFLYQLYKLSHNLYADRKFILLGYGAALYLEIWGLIGTMVDLHSVGSNPGNRWSLAVGILSLIYDLASYIRVWNPRNWIWNAEFSEV